MMTHYMLYKAIFGTEGKKYKTRNSILQWMLETLENEFFAYGIPLNVNSSVVVSTMKDSCT